MKKPGRCRTYCDVRGGMETIMPSVVKGVKGRGRERTEKTHRLMENGGKFLLTSKTK